MSRTSSPPQAQIEGGKRLAAILQELATAVAPGVPTSLFDDHARTLFKKHDVQPAFLGYRGYPATVCVSVNDEVVHGIPSPDRMIQPGDLLSLDIGCIHDGWYVDMAITTPVGSVSTEARELLQTTRESLARGISAIQPGAHVGDIGYAVQSAVSSKTYGIVRSLTGHGIGKALHEPPQIPNVGEPGTGPRLLPGMVLAIEPMITIGNPEVETLDDQWTIRTKDHSLAAHFEQTVAVTENGARILTA